MENVHCLCSGHLSVALANTMTTRNSGREENIYLTGYTTSQGSQGKNSRKRPADRDWSKNKENCFTGFLFTTCLAYCIIKSRTSHLSMTLPTARWSFLHQFATNKKPFTIDNRPVWWRQFSAEVLFFLVTLGLYQIDSRHYDNSYTENDTYERYKRSKPIEKCSHSGDKTFNVLIKQSHADSVGIRKQAITRDKIALKMLNKVRDSCSL